jgi:hypothetical protein
VAATDSSDLEKKKTILHEFYHKTKIDRVQDEKVKIWPSLSEKLKEIELGLHHFHKGA